MIVVVEVDLYNCFVQLAKAFGDVYDTEACYAWWTVTAEKDQVNTTACLSGSFIQQFYLQSHKKVLSHAEIQIADLLFQLQCSNLYFNKPGHLN